MDLPDLSNLRRSAHAKFVIELHNAQPTPVLTVNYFDGENSFPWPIAGTAPAEGPQGRAFRWLVAMAAKAVGVPVEDRSRWLVVGRG